MVGVDLHGQYKRWTGDWGLLTADWGLRTADYGLGIKHRVMNKAQTEHKTRANSGIKWTLWT